MDIKIEKWLTKAGCFGLLSVGLLTCAAQESEVGVEEIQEYFGADYERDEQAQQELREWLLRGVPGEFGDQAGDQLAEQERDFLDLPEPERFMASEPRQLITPASPESLSGDYADEEESSASRERFGQQSTSRSASRNGGGSDVAGSEDGYAADFDEQGRRLRKPRLIKQEKLVSPVALRVPSWTYAQAAAQVGAAQGLAHREPTNDHRACMELLMQEMRDGSYTD